MKNLSLIFTAALWLLPLQSSALEALPRKAPVPADNPMTADKIELGKMLFFDPRLSKNGTISCNSCHNVMAGGDDNRPFSFGIEGKFGARSSPTVWNAAFHSVQFWDGRAKDLEEQAKGPIENPVEMGATHALVVSRVAELDEYKKLFAKVFGKDQKITIDHVAQAIAAYERTLITPDSPVDQYVRGNKKALTTEEIKGMQVFETTGCTSCHGGVNYAGPDLPAGQPFFMKFPVFPGSEYEKKYKLTADPGRFEVTKNEADRQMWRVPTLRNIALTAPYFHNGSVSTLDEAVRVMAKTQLNKDLSDDEAKNLVAFLKALTGKFPKQTMPILPPSPGKSLIDSGM